MLSGKGRYTLNQEVLNLDPTRYLLIDRKSHLSIRLKPRRSTTALPFFSLRHGPRSADQTTGRLCWLERAHPMDPTLQERLQWLVRLGNNCSSFSALKADAMIGDMLREMIHEALAAEAIANRLPVSRRSTRIELFKRLSLARDWIHANYASPLPLDKMAETALLNSQHFLRMFRDCYGITPHQYVIDVRLTAARHLLLETKEPVSAICRSTGFESLSSFSGLFRHRFGDSPKAFRQKLTPSAHS